MTVTYLQAPKNVSKEGRGDAVASVTFLPLQPLPLALLFPSNSAGRRDACVLWGHLHLRFQCQICAFTHRSFLSSSVIRPMRMLLSSSRKLDGGGRRNKLSSSNTGTYCCSHNCSYQARKSHNFFASAQSPSRDKAPAKPRWQPPQPETSAWHIPKGV